MTKCHQVEAEQMAHKVHKMLNNFMMILSASRLRCMAIKKTRLGSMELDCKVMKT